MTTIELGIESNQSAFAALKTDGTVVAWGNSGNGGSVPSDVELSDVKAIYPNSYAFAALKEDGTVERGVIQVWRQRAVGAERREGHCFY